MIDIDKIKDKFPNVSEDVLRANGIGLQPHRKPKVKTIPDKGIQVPNNDSGSPKRHATIKINYPGSIITENHAFGRNGKNTYMKPEARDWQNDLIFLLSKCEVKDWKLPLKVKISGVFKNLRESPDTQNMKIVYDSIKKVIGIDDKFYHTETEPPVINKSVSPYLLITISEI